jgi:hypothetical protein
MIKKNKSKKAVARATLDSVTKEMARPRFAESCTQEEEEAIHGVAKHHGFVNIEPGRLSADHRSTIEYHLTQRCWIEGTDGKKAEPSK